MYKYIICIIFFVSCVILYLFWTEEPQIDFSGMVSNHANIESSPVNRFRMTSLAMENSTELFDSLYYYIDKYHSYNNINELKQKKYLNNGNKWYKSWLNKIDNKIIDWRANVVKIADTDMWGDERGAIIILEIVKLGSSDVIEFDNGFYIRSAVNRIYQENSPQLYTVAEKLDKGQTVKFSGIIKNRELTLNSLDEIRNVFDIEYTKMEYIAPY